MEREFLFEDWRDRLQTAVDAYLATHPKAGLKTICKGAKVNDTFLRDILERGQSPSVDNIHKVLKFIGAEWSYIFGGEHIDSEEIAQNLMNTEMRRLLKQVQDLSAESQALIIANLRNLIDTARRARGGKLPMIVPPQVDRARKRA